MKNCKIIPSFVKPEGSETGILISWFLFYYSRKIVWMRSVIHHFSVLLRTGFNPSDINQIRSHNGNIVKIKRKRQVYTMIRIDPSTILRYFTYHLRMLSSLFLNIGMPCVVIKINTCFDKSRGGGSLTPHPPPPLISFQLN